jgi:hypothetical protein
VGEGANRVTTVMSKFLNQKHFLQFDLKSEKMKENSIYTIIKK